MTKEIGSLSTAIGCDNAILFNPSEESPLRTAGGRRTPW
jgi:hypothetical protein